MDPTTFRVACKALREFVEQPPDRNGRRRVVGMIGGEPLHHPEFRRLVGIMRDVFPDASKVGLWTSETPKSHNWPYVERLLGLRPTTTVYPVGRGEGGYLNWNRHDSECYHQPVLVGIQDVIDDEETMWELIESCPLQEEWSGTITPKGFFFCEVAGAMDLAFDGPGGMPVNCGCWKHDLADYREQIERWCPRCGVCLPLKGRRDTDRLDDISDRNANDLAKLGSPRVLDGGIVRFDASKREPPEHWAPLRYLRGR